MSRYKPTFKVPGPPRKAWNSNSKHINKKAIRLFDTTQEILDIENSLILEEAALEYADEMRPRGRNKCLKSKCIK